MCTNLVFGLRVEDDSYCSLVDSTQRILTLTYYFAALGIAVYAMSRPTVRDGCAHLAAACVTALLAPFALETTVLIFVAACSTGIVFVLCMPEAYDEVPPPTPAAIANTRIEPCTCNDHI